MLLLIMRTSSSLQTLKTKNSKRLISRNSNINAINNKFEQLKYIIKNNIDVLIVIETKLDFSFPSSQISRDEFAQPFPRDRNKNRCGVMTFVRYDIPSKEIEVTSDVECLSIELNIRKVKWLVAGCYHSPSQNGDYYSAILVKYWINSNFKF